MKTKNINIILFIILVLICIMLLYGLFNNKHNEVYNEMNKMILKEKFNTDRDCMSTNKICEDIRLVCQGNDIEECENTTKYSAYCKYLSEIQDVLKSDCFTCDEKQDIINTARRVKCSSPEDAMDDAMDDATSSSD